jgi:D-tyrosyl-tRNA(Tyr) deacylase
MRLVIQRVKDALIIVDQKEIAKINTGVVCLLGIHKADNELNCTELAKKVVNLRIFEDEQGKMNKSIVQINGEILVVSQFTLYADCTDGHRPSFTDAMEAKSAENLYQRFVKELHSLGVKIQTGLFGAKMEVKLNNYGPVTIILEA